jgi:hypothetical protein
MKSNILMVLWCALSFASTGCAAEGGERAPADESPAADDVQGTEGEEPSADLASVRSGIFHPIKNAGSGMCLQPQGGSTGVATLVQRPCLADGDPESDQQGWLFQSLGGSNVTIVNQRSGLCAYLNGEARDGTDIIQAECNGTTNTRWKVQTTSGVTTIMSRLRNRDTGFCAEMFNGLPIDGSVAKVFRCFGTPQQAWVVGF